MSLIVTCSGPSMLVLSFLLMLTVAAAVTPSTGALTTANGWNVSLPPGDSKIIWMDEKTDTTGLRFPNYTIQCYKLSTGERLWTRRMHKSVNGGIDYEPVVFEGILFSSDASVRINAVNLTTGETIWAAKRGSIPSDECTSFRRGMVWVQNDTMNGNFVNFVGFDAKTGFVGDSFKIHTSWVHHPYTTPGCLHWVTDTFLFVGDQEYSPGNSAWWYAYNLTSGDSPYRLNETLDVIVEEKYVWWLQREMRGMNLYDAFSGTKEMELSIFPRYVQAFSSNGANPTANPWQYSDVVEKKKKRSNDAVLVMAEYNYFGDNTTVVAYDAKNGNRRWVAAASKHIKCAGGTGGTTLWTQRNAGTADFFYVWWNGANGPWEDSFSCAMALDWSTGQDVFRRCVDGGSGGSIVGSHFASGRHLSMVSAAEHSATFHVWKL